MRMKIVTLGSLASACLMTWHVNAYASSADSSAYDASLSLNAGGVTVSLPPLNDVAGSAPPDYSVANSVASYNTSQTLGLLGLPLETFSVTTGILNSSASGTSSSATASASIHDLDAIFATVGVPTPLLELTALTIASTSTAGGGAPNGSSTIESLTLSGSLLGAPITFSIPSPLPPNDIVFDTGGLEIVLNEQTPLPGGIATNAVDVIVTNVNYVGSPIEVSGNLILSHSQAQVFSSGSVPEPAAWTMIILGIAGLGAIVRRRRVVATA